MQKVCILRVSSILFVLYSSSIGQNLADTSFRYPTLSTFNDFGMQDTTGLYETISAFYSAIEHGNVEGRIQLLADEVILMPNHWTIMRGKKSVSESFRGSAAAVFKIKDRMIVTLEVQGDMAYTVNSYYYTYHDRTQSPQWHKTKNVHIWRRDVNGEWKLILDIWNSDVPIDQFGKE